MVTSIIVAFAAIFAGGMTVNHITGSLAVQAENSPAADAMNDLMCSIQDATGALIPILLIVIFVLMVVSLTRFMGAVG